MDGPISLSAGIAMYDLLGVLVILAAVALVLWVWFG